MNPEKTGNDSKLKFDDKSLKFSDHPTFNFALAICWIAAVFAVLGTLFLWWTNNDTKAALKDKEAEKSSVVAEITSPTYADVEKRATGFKSAVSALTAAAKERYSMDVFLKTLYTKITNDSTITSISITQDGTINITGQTKSYRSVAELMVALDSWNALNKVDLTSVSMGTGDQSSSGATFSISAEINKKVDLTGTSATTSSTESATSSSLSSEGASETIQ
jgi:Tfp pilus assembly protein PilN